MPKSPRTAASGKRDAPRQVSPRTRHIVIAAFAFSAWLRLTPRNQIEQYRSGVEGLCQQH